MNQETTNQTTNQNETIDTDFPNPYSVQEHLPQLNNTKDKSQKADGSDRQETDLTLVKGIAKMTEERLIKNDVNSQAELKERMEDEEIKSILGSNYKAVAEHFGIEIKTENSSNDEAEKLKLKAIKAHFKNLEKMSKDPEISKGKITIKQGKKTVEMTAYKYKDRVYTVRDQIDYSSKSKSWQIACTKTDARYFLYLEN